MHLWSPEPAHNNSGIPEASTRETPCGETRDTWDTPLSSCLSLPSTADRAFSEASLSENHKADPGTTRSKNIVIVSHWVTQFRDNADTGTFRGPVRGQQYLFLQSPSDLYIVFKFLSLELPWCAMITECGRTKILTKKLTAESGQIKWEVQALRRGLLPFPPWPFAHSTLL